MKNFYYTICDAIRTFLKDQDGAQVVEYALIIAVVSIALIVALRALIDNGSFTTFITRVENCLITPSTCISQ